MSSQRSAGNSFRLVILMPVFCDWETVALLCRKIDQQLGHLEGISTRVLIVDDGSCEPLHGWIPFEPLHITRIDALLLRRNMGHQRAIAVGLSMIQDEIECDAVVVMDADGEDRPEDIVRLVNRSGERPGCIVFAARGRRFESFGFRVGYRAYRLLHRVLTGVSVRAGNFSIVPRSALVRLVSMSELWNHYAGAIYKSRLEYSHMPAERGHRLAGRSRMDFVALVVHGLSGISTFYDVVATRILIASVVSLLALLLVLGVVLGIRLMTNLAIPGWATFTTGLLLLLMAQCASISFSPVFSLITTRTNNTFVPARDYRDLVQKLEPLWTTPRRPIRLSTTSATS
jgi:polyisoprenyl-phosphate glycosyltransferase